MKRPFSIIGSHITKIGIIVTILLISTLLNLRVDTSRDKAFSISKISKNLVRDLDEAMVVKIISTRELPAELTSLSRYTSDLLAEFQSASRGKFRYEYIRPASFEELSQLAAANNLRPMRFQNFENDRMTSKEVIFGMVIEYQGRVESMNLMPSLEPKLEYEMTMRIQSLVSDTLPKVAVFRDSTYYHFNTRFFERGIKSNFNVIDADLSKPLKDVDALLFTGASRNLPEEYLYHIDQYLMSGGKVVFLQDKVDTDGQNLYSLNTNVIRMLDHYGFQLSTDVLLDMNCDQRQMGIGNIANFPMYPIMRGSNHIISRGMDYIVLYLASGITVKPGNGVDFETILQSSQYSGWMLAPEFKINESLFFNPELEDFSAGPVTTATMGKGRFSSFFEDNPMAEADPSFQKETTAGTVVLFADKELVIDPDNPIYNDRSNVILNALDHLFDRDAMISIRNRHLRKSPLMVRAFMEKNGIIWGDMEKIENNLKLIAKIVAIALPPLILILVGLWLAFKRRLKLRTLNEEK